MSKIELANVNVESMNRKTLKEAADTLGVSLDGLKPQDAKAAVAAKIKELLEAGHTQWPAEEVAAEKPAAGETPTEEKRELTLDERIEQMVAARLEAALKGAKVGKAKAPKAEKVVPALVVAPFRAPFMLPSPEQVANMTPLDRMNILLDAAETVGFGEDLVAKLEAVLQKAIEKHSDVTFFLKYPIPTRVMRFWKTTGFDVAASCPTYDAVAEAVQQAQIAIKANENAAAQAAATEAQAAASK